jgi:hypothetical protein
VRKVVSVVHLEWKEWALKMDEGKKEEDTE